MCMFRCIFVLFRLLLQYHDAELCAHFDRNHISPELYATEPFITLFAKSTPLPLVYAVWDIYLIEADSFLHYFIMLALLIKNRKTLMTVSQLCSNHNIPSLWYTCLLFLLLLSNCM